ncbi:MAG: hypothetical protein D9C04_04290 [Nitrosopumilus sp. B06]|nr:MAG: hypothetical protein D9C04_04290 [Nitrosopumilus sp. B06]
MHGGPKNAKEKRRTRTPPDPDAAAKKMVREYTKEYDKRCLKPGEKQKFPSPMFGPDAIV